MAGDSQQLCDGTRLIKSYTLLELYAPFKSVFSVEGDVDEELFVSVMVLPWRRYQFYVTAVNQIGESDLSDAASSAQCVTPATTPNRNPDNVCSRLPATKRLVIVWTVTAK